MTSVWMGVFFTLGHFMKHHAFATMLFSILLIQTTVCLASAPAPTRSIAHGILKRQRGEAYDFKEKVAWMKFLHDYQEPFQDNFRKAAETFNSTDTDEEAIVKLERLSENDDDEVTPLAFRLLWFDKCHREGIPVTNLDDYPLAQALSFVSDTEATINLEELFDVFETPQYLIDLTLVHYPQITKLNIQGLAYMLPCPEIISSSLKELNLFNNPIEAQLFIPGMLLTNPTYYPNPVKIKNLYAPHLTTLNLDNSTSYEVSGYLPSLKHKNVVRDSRHFVQPTLRFVRPIRRPLPPPPSRFLRDTLD